MRRALAVAALVVIAAIGACRAFLPERFAVNAPLVGTLLGAAPPAKSELERRLKLPNGFAVALFADGISNARFLRFTPAGDLLVSSPREGTVSPMMNGRFSYGSQTQGTQSTVVRHARMALKPSRACVVFLSWGERRLFTCS